MRFFIPKTYDDDEAQEVREATRAFLDMQGLPTDPRRIWKLSLTLGGLPAVLKVGGRHPETEEEILVIFKAAVREEYYLCTATRGVVTGAPLTVASESGRVLVVDFR